MIHRGRDRTPCFTDDQDRDFYRHYLGQASEYGGCAIHAYVLMTNHVHLLVTPSSRESAARTMQAIGRSYVLYFNRRHTRTGPMWDGRFRSIPIDSEQYFLACSRYIESNPVRAGMVTHPADYRWSSFRYNALGFADSRITPHSIYLGLDDRALSRQARYAALFSSSLDASVVDVIRGVEGRSARPRKRKTKQHQLDAPVSS
jgi:putative transposase